MMFQKNLAQEEAVQTHNGPVLLVSCPGSGKTTTMLRRINSMITSGIQASSIVMVTFTDAAAQEMGLPFPHCGDICSPARLRREYIPRRAAGHRHNADHSLRGSGNRDFPEKMH